FYTGYGYEWVDNKLETRIRQGIAWLDSNFNVEKRAYLRFKDDHKYYYYPTKDSTIISMSNNKARILTRPSIMDLEVGWKTEIDLNDPVVNINKLEPVLWFEEWETHVGWSTNTVKISSNEYLVGWHGCSRIDLAYRNGLAVVNGEGELIGITDYLLSPRGLVETFGDRPYVIFGDGLILVKDQLLWIGGISDYAIGIFETEINQVFENMKWLSG
ncbi:MAG: glycosidase, partial [Candidatus Aenigmatarchaeota archaeon]